MVLVTWFSVALVLMVGIGGATLGTLVLLYDVMSRDFLTTRERGAAHLRIAAGFAIAAAAAAFVAVVGPGLCRGCP